MPGFDGSGPSGLGPMTGRGLGPCCQVASGRGRAGRGFGRGFGRRRSGRVGMAGMPIEQPVMSETEEKEVLKEELKEIEAEKKEVEKRLKELKV